MKPLTLLLLLSTLVLAGCPSPFKVKDSVPVHIDGTEAPTIDCRPYPFPDVIAVEEINDFYFVPGGLLLSDSFLQSLKDSGTTVVDLAAISEDAEVVRIENGMWTSEDDYKRMSNLWDSFIRFEEQVRAVPRHFVKCIRAFNTQAARMKARQETGDE